MLKLSVGGMNGGEKTEFGKVNEKGEKSQFLDEEELSSSKCLSSIGMILLI